MTNTSTTNITVVYILHLFFKNAKFQLEISVIQVVIFPLFKFITLNSVYGLRVHPGTQSKEPLDYEEG